MLRLPWHLIPFLSGENPIGSPVRKIWGTSRELIESCTDLDTLNGWFRCAFKVDKASDLFAE